MISLITGSSGFIGQHLFNYLEKDRIGFDLRDGCDIHSKSSLQSFVDECNIVYHLAANKSVQNLDQQYYESVDGTFNLLECMKESPRCKTIIFTSTSAVYGYGGENAIFSEDFDPPKPISMYAAAKAAAENLICGYCYTYGLKAIIFRIANVVGPGGSGVVPDLVRKLKEDPSQLEILGDGQQLKSYIHVDDVVSALTTVNKPDRPFQVYNLTTKDTISVNEIADMIIEKMGLKDVAKTYKDSWLGDVHSYAMYNFKLKNTGWQPKYPTSREAIMKVLEEL